MSSVDSIIEYHEATKHGFDSFAPGPGFMDWANQPEAFRKFEGTELKKLKIFQPTDMPTYDQIFESGRGKPEKLDYDTLSRFLFDTLSISAWKEAGESRWALRVNPSSGNLHPTEAYIISGPVDGFSDKPFVGHYRPDEHALEIRAIIPGLLWKQLAKNFGEDCFLVGLSSIHWREAWKYGERAFRYCHHDIGHAIGTISMAAAGLGREISLIEKAGTVELMYLMGLHDPGDIEPELPECIMAVYPADMKPANMDLSPKAAAQFAGLEWKGKPNRLSPSRIEWPILQKATKDCIKPRETNVFPEFKYPEMTINFVDRGISFRKIIRQRRSAVEMDGETSIKSDIFYRMLYHLMPGETKVPFNCLPWRPMVHLVFFVHRVEGLKPGLYCLIRNNDDLNELKASMLQKFRWEKVEGCPEDLPLYVLDTGDIKDFSKQLSCFQDIAADGCFAAAMVCRFRRPIREFGSWFYTRLYWECGFIGQILYLEAEAAGVRGTGIGCYFDDPTHTLLGLSDNDFQDLYHFTVGGPIEDTRLTTKPGYPEE